MYPRPDELGYNWEYVPGDEGMIGDLITADEYEETGEVGSLAAIPDITVEEN